MTSEPQNLAPAQNATAGFVQGVVEAQPQGVPSQTVDLGTGTVLTGVQPATAPTPTTPVMQVAAGTGVIGPQPNPNGNTLQQQGAPPTNGPRVFTEEEVNKIRNDEKTKVYGQLETVNAELTQLREWRQQQEAAAAAAQQEAEEQARREAESGMSAQQLLEQERIERQREIAEMRTQMETQQALMEREREFSALSSYRSQRMDQERETILPELIDLVAGNTQEEIEASIASLKQRTESIVGNVQAATQQARQQMVGTSVTAPPVGPVETQSSQITLTPDDVRKMDMATYAQQRVGLLDAASRQYRGR